MQRREWDKLLLSIVGSMLKCVAVKHATSKGIIYIEMSKHAAIITASIEQT